MTKQLIAAHGISVVAALLIIGLFVLLWSYFIGINYPPVVFGPNLGYIKPPAGRCGDYVRLCRDITFTREAEVLLERSFTTEDYPQDGQLTIGLPHDNVVRQAGSFSQCRILQIPYGIPTGNWKLHTTVVYDSWPFWTYKTEAPTVDFKVIE